MGQQLRDIAIAGGGQAGEHVEQPGMGSCPLALAVASRLMIVAARRPADSEPTKSQFLRPSATGRIAFSIRLLSIG